MQTIYVFDNNTSARRLREINGHVIWPDWGKSDADSAVNAAIHIMPSDIAIHLDLVARYQGRFTSDQPRKVVMLFDWGLGQKAECMRLIGEPAPTAFTSPPIAPTLAFKEAVQTLVSSCHGASVRGGWWNGIDPKDPGVFCTKLALIHSELSEALEGYRKNLNDDHLPHRKSVEVELGDVAIRLFDLAGALELDLGGAMTEKMEYNTKREDHTVDARATDNGKKF